MLRRTIAAAAAVEEVTPRTKTRKRCALSSSSSGASDTLRKLRLKRGVVFRRSSPCLGSRRKMSESSWNGRRRADGMHSSVSARKLVSALWQMSEGGLLEEEDEKAGVARDAAARRGSAAHRRCASLMEIARNSRTKSKVLDADRGEWFSDKLSNGGRIGVHACAADSSSTCSVDRMAHLHDLYNSLTASKELVRVLATVWGPGVLNPSTASLLSALRSELDRARANARQIAREQSRRRGDDVEHLKERLAAEAHAWKSRQREKVAATVRAAAEELDAERRSRRRAERVNGQLGKALAETESSLEAARRELERERRSRERLEKVCDELVRGAASTSSTVCEVEEMRREAEVAQAELDKEREMLRLADELREERVSMKLLEARLQFEEKNAVVEQLRGELEAFLETKKQESSVADEHHASEAEGANGIARVSDRKRTDGEFDDDDDREEEDDSEGSDMHSIELNMDGNVKDGGWSYSTAANSKDMTKSKKAASSVGSKGTECAVDPWPGASFDRPSPEESDDGGQQWDWDVDDEGCSDTTRDVDHDSERYQAIKNLREQMLAGHGSIFTSQADEGNANSKQHRYVRLDMTK